MLAALSKADSALQVLKLGKKTAARQNTIGKLPAVLNGGVVSPTRKGPS